MFGKPSERMSLDQIWASCGCRCILPWCLCSCMSALKRETCTVTRMEHKRASNKAAICTGSLLTVLTMPCWMLYAPFPLARSMLQHPWFAILWGLCSLLVLKMCGTDSARAVQQRTSFHQHTSTFLLVLGKLLQVNLGGISVCSEAL